MHLQDLWYEYLKTGLPLQVKEDAFYGEQAELFDWSKADLQVTARVLTNLGWMHFVEVEFTLAGLAVFNAGGFTHATLPVAYISSLIEIIGAKDLQADTFIGGTISGGTAIPQFPTNLDDPQDPPLQSYDGGVTVDVAGTLISTDHVTSGGQGADESFVSGGIIAPPATTIYSTYTNLDAGSVDINISTLFSALPDVPA